MENTKTTTEQESPKLPYHRPTLKQWGTVADLTQTSAGMGEDPLSGSIDCGS